MADGRFLAAINCMDGRTQDPVADWAKRTFGVDYVDAITEPGPDALLADADPRAVPSIRARVEISVNVHRADTIVMVSHHDCAGNPVSKEEHLQQLAKAVDMIRSWNLPARVVGIWVNERWEVEVIDDGQGGTI